MTRHVACAWAPLQRMMAGWLAARGLYALVSVWPATPGWITSGAFKAFDVVRLGGGGL